MSDRRIFERYRVDLPVSFLCKETNEEYKGRLIDISANGIGMILTKSNISLGAHLEVWVTLPDNKEPIYLTGVLVWVKELDSDMMRIGVQFDKIDFMSMWRILDIIKK